MVLHIPNFVIHAITYASMGYFTYTFYQMYKIERQVKKLDALILAQQSRGEKVVIPEYLQAAYEYKNNHFGQKILERMQTQHVLEEQIQYTIDKKIEIKEKLSSEHNQEEIAKLEEELARLTELFTKVKNDKRANNQ